jgi:hypothetical protein
MTLMRMMLGSCLWFVIAGCSTVTWVNDVSTIPDASRVSVVGAQYKIGWFGDVSADKPVRWECLRGADGRLNCTPDTSDLPKVD